MEISINALKKVAMFFVAAITACTAIAQVPTITSFSPKSGPIGTPVTIKGTNFDSTPSNNIVYFGATQATVLTATVTQLTVSVPAGATYQPLSVLVGGLTAYAAAPFVITFSGGAIDQDRFKTKAKFPVGNLPYGFAISDINNDGKPDVASAAYQTNSISILKNNSLANLYSFSLDFVPAFGQSGRGIAIGDLDGDGNPDIALDNDDESGVCLLRNQTASGSVDFATKVDFLSAGRAYGIAIGDLDLDGKPDLVVATTDWDGGHPRIAVFKNTSSTGTVTTSSFAPAISFVISASPRDLAIADVDADGKPDIIATTYILAFDIGGIDVFKNTATGGVINSSSFSPKVSFSINGQPIAVAVGDLDGDGQPDLVTANTNNNNISILRNTTTAGVINSSSFAAKVDLATGKTALDVALSDLDGDGKVDIAGVNFNNPLNEATLSVFRNIATAGVITTGSFAARVDYELDDMGYAIDVGDLNGDGPPEIVVATEQRDSAIYVLGQWGCENCATNEPPAITTTTVTTQIGGTATIDVSTLLSDPDNNLDLSTLKITMQPISGAVATLDNENQLITINYTGISFSGTDRLGIEVCDIAASCVEQELQVEVIGDVIVFNAISPNGDGLNDIFRIQFIEIIPETQGNQVSIYNRWGDTVFEVTDYNNSDRVFTGLSKSGKELPSGIYFYKIQFTSGKEMKTGYLSLKQ